MDKLLFFSISVVAFASFFYPSIGMARPRRVVDTKGRAEMRSIQRRRGRTFQRRNFSAEGRALSGYSIGGYIGQWGNMPSIGVRGALPLSPLISLRMSISLLFAVRREPSFSLSSLSVELKIRLPSRSSALRHYTVTRLDFWPMLDPFNTSPSLSSISDKATFGISLLLGTESFLLEQLSLFLEAGFSSGMMISLSQIKSQFEAFGFIILSGFQIYF